MSTSQRFRIVNPYCFFLFSYSSPSTVLVQHFFHHQKPGGGYTRQNMPTAGARQQIVDSTELKAVSRGLLPWGDRSITFDTGRGTIFHTFPLSGNATAKSTPAPLLHPSPGRTLGPGGACLLLANQF